MKILGATWYSPWTTNLDIIGIVKVNDYGEIKYYIGTGAGENEQEDIENIVEKGAKFYPEYFIGGGK